MTIVSQKPLSEHKNPVICSLIAQVRDKLLDLPSAKRYLMCREGGLLSREASRRAARAIRKIKIKGSSDDSPSNMRVKTMYRQRREAIAEVLCVAIYFAKFNTGAFEVSIARIARYTGINETRIQRAMNDLRAMGAIQNFGRSLHKVMRRQISPLLYQALGINVKGINNLAKWKEAREHEGMIREERRHVAENSMQIQGLLASVTKSFKLPRPK